MQKVVGDAKPGHSTRIIAPTKPTKPTKPNPEGVK
jgi:hypothetical protein